MARYFYVIVSVAFVGHLFVISEAYSASKHAAIGCQGCHDPYELDKVLKERSQGKVSTNKALSEYWGLDQVQDSSESVPGNYNSMYTSTTFDAVSDNRPTGISKLCLSCHDGTSSMMDQGPAVKVRNSHPISFLYDSTLAVKDGGLKDPSQFSGIGGTIAEDLLDANGKMQCTSCHSIHSFGGEGRRLVGQLSNNNSELCLMCHVK